ncbi:hypothetical protein [Mesorhizobium onobrychidis]|uniref:Uncharacterized protein n=1 Tax=Mesorhizobium onobrychidis TaxID=2775404 RepID=A0ABY5QVS3_9HYPH|nr:hypothetical protein [Mesorhizobium onobrychidis]UVC15295.1 hypothetical protein IHQ72_32995 [Mesorhizobium onobrychidis]
MNDISVLDAWSGKEQELHQSVIADTRFAVYRLQLSTYDKSMPIFSR